MNAASDEGLHSRLSVSRQIVSVSCGVYVDADGSAVLLVDPSDEEVAGVHATVTVAADQDGQVCHVSQVCRRILEVFFFVTIFCSRLAAALAKKQLLMLVEYVTRRLLQLYDMC